MAPIENPSKAVENPADLLNQLGGISPTRVRLRPPPGLATEDDIAAIDIHIERACELIDGVLVEKVLGFCESFLAVALGCRRWEFVRPLKLGVITGSTGTMRLAPGLVRVPEVAFVSWDRFPDRRVPSEPVPDLAPDLAVEFLSEGNTLEELARKRREYFRAGVRLVWTIDQSRRTARVDSAPDRAIELVPSGTLDGGVVLPCFVLPLGELFAELDHGKA